MADATLIPVAGIVEQRPGDVPADFPQVNVPASIARGGQEVATDDARYAPLQVEITQGEISQDVAARPEIQPLKNEGNWVDDRMSAKYTRRHRQEGVTAQDFERVGVDNRNAQDDDSFNALKHTLQTMAAPYKAVGEAVLDVNEEAGRAIAKAGHGILKNIFDVSDELGEFMADNWMFGGRFGIYSSALTQEQARSMRTNVYLYAGEDGTWKLSVGERPDDYEPVSMPEFMHNPETIVGGIASGIMQFAGNVALLHAGSAGTIPLKAVKWMTTTGIADALFDPEDGGLSTMLMAIGVDRNAVLDFLDPKVDKDSDYEDRLLGRGLLSLEGLMIGLPFDLTAVVLRTIKTIRANKQLAAQASAHLERQLQIEAAQRLDPAGAQQQAVPVVDAAPSRAVSEGAAQPDQPLLTPSGRGESPRLQAKLEKLKDTVPGFAKVIPYLLPQEAANLTRRSAEKILRMMKAFPEPSEMASVAYAGRAKRGWYQRSGDAIVEVFGAYDAPRFSTLLAALSPQTSVESNTINTLRVWNAWVREGRPTDDATILRILGENVQGDNGLESVMDSWINNSLIALQAENPTILDPSVLSGAKVDSFQLNLMGYINSVTNDAWMLNYSGMTVPGSTATPFSKSGTKNPGTSPGYKAFSANVRKAAEILTRRTGEVWTPREVQETIWSWAKALYEAGDTVGENRQLVEILEAGGLTHADIADTPDFGLLFAQGIYKRILEEGGYGREVQGLDRAAAGRSDGAAEAGGSTFDPEGSGVAGATYERHLRSGAERLQHVRRVRAKYARIKSVRAAGWDNFDGRPTDGLQPAAYAQEGRAAGEVHLDDLQPLAPKRTPLDPSDVVQVHTPHPETLKAVRGSAVKYPEYVELKRNNPKTAGVFHKAISQARKAMGRAGDAVHVYDKFEYMGMRTFVTADGKSGFALNGDDIVSVFTTAPGGNVAQSMLQLAVAQGGRKLDAFDIHLPAIYSHSKFRVVARTPWDDSQAPPKWSKSFWKDYNNGEPDVVFMVYDPDRMFSSQKVHDVYIHGQGEGQMFDSYLDAASHQHAAVQALNKKIGPPAGEDTSFLTAKQLEGVAPDRADPVQGIVDAIDEVVNGPPDVAPTQAADSPPPGGFFNEGAAGQIKLTEVENRYFGELLGNEANREELLEWVPSLKIEDGQLSVTREHAEGLWKFIEDSVVLDGPGTVPPRLKKEKFWNTLMGEQEYEWSSTYDKFGRTVPPSWVGGD